MQGSSAPLFNSPQSISHDILFRQEGSHPANSACKGYFEMCFFVLSWGHWHPQQNQNSSRWRGIKR